MFPTCFIVSAYTGDVMVTFRYKSFSSLFLFLLVLVLTEYGCGGRNDPLVDDKGNPGDENDAGDDGQSETTDGISDDDDGGEVTCVDMGTDPDRNRVKPGNICDRLSTIQCAAESCCCKNPKRDFDECKDGMEEYCREHLKIDAVSSDSLTGFDPDIAEEGFSEYEEMASSCDTDVVSWGTSLDGLRSIIKGTIDEGKPCTPKGDWGKTLDEAGAAALASCKDPENTACSHPAVLIWTCLPRVDVGDGCITDLNCLEGLYCDNPNLALRGAQCKKRKKIGSACTYPNECQSLICKDGECAKVNQQNVYCLSN